MEYRFLSISLPKNSDMEIIRIQNKLFRDFGFASALCLPVCFPVFYLDHTLEKKEAIRRLKLPSVCFPIECTELIEEHGFFFLHTNPASRIIDFVRHIVSSFEEHPAIDGRATTRMLTPVTEGVFLSCNETSVSIGTMREAIGPLPKLGFSSYSLALIDIHVHAAGEPWWNDVSWEIIWEKRLYKNID